ncbi:aminopeptidase N [Sorangium cellulosum]|uniref:Aminopeptidase N n=1 Tax=Sorangium cellulosum TaxID=56 RepID=A0A4P2PXF1_SORCE|nr:aminopeptidase N [Sorangium cellulosum]AUX21545.1 aminopeptidase N [Sorangium cellulosum]
MTEKTGGPGRDVLTQKEAEERAARIGNVRYELSLDLSRGRSGYRGEAIAYFDVRGRGDTFIDFRGRRIERLEINGVAVDPAWADCRILLPGKLLDPETRVRVVYENDYDHTGDGFHHFRDPEDGEEYLYSDFEPFSAHRLFPCFDQPDIKASYRLSVTAPDDWEVIGNARITRTMAAGAGRSTRVFEETTRFSTYIFALVAGPYSGVRDEHRGIPLGLYCRRSLAKHLDAEELFTITKQGFDFYPDFFDYPYPFTKYDQIFVPEFNAGAMENVGAVTHSERMIFRDPPTDHQRLTRAEVLLHEMAHMWFGNLVTMRWWNDLWLNESFATYMAFLAMERATRFRPAAWQAFNVIKSWAYRQDQLVTTHPIAGELADTEHTFLNFDGITYGKGAAAMKQLVAAIGLPAFRDGMRRYFKRYQYGNATLREFLSALEEGSGRDLGAWSRVWLEQASLNTLTAEWEAEGDRIGRLRVVQTAPVDYPTLRPHRIDVALAREEGGALVIDAVPAEIDGAATEVAAARGRRAPRLVFPNHNDLTFAKIALDPGSLAFVREHLGRVEDPLLRQLLWASLWSMVRDQKLASPAYLALVRDKLPAEPDLTIVEPVLGNAVMALARYVPDALREAEASAFTGLALSALRAARGDAQIVWARTLLSVAYSAPDLALAARLVDGELGVEGLEIDQEMRWTVAVKWVARGMEGAAERLEAEKRRDPSDRGQRAALRAETARPDAAAKAAAWERFHGDGYGSLHLTGAAMSGFNWSFQRALLEPYVAAFFEQVPKVFEERTHELASAYFTHLFPSYRVDREVLGRAESRLAALQAAPEGAPVAAPRLPMLVRMLREASDDLVRAIACRELVEAEGGGGGG